MNPVVAWHLTYHTNHLTITYASPLPKLAVPYPYARVRFDAEYATRHIASPVLPGLKTHSVASVVGGASLSPAVVRRPGKPG